MDFLPAPNLDELANSVRDAINSAQSNSPIGQGLAQAQDLLTKIREIDPRVAEFLSNASKTFGPDGNEGIVKMLQASYEALLKGDYTFFTSLPDTLFTSPQGNGSFEKYIDNRIAQQNTQQNQNYETQMRDTSLLSTANQLNSLGLSPSNVIQVGGMSHNGVGTADTMTRSVSALRQQRVMNQYNQRMGLAKQVIGMAGQMASSGIYGGALNAAKNAGAKLASATAHSGLVALKHFSGQGNKSFADDSNFMAQWNKLPGQGL